MHIQTYSQQLQFVPPKACLGNIALVNYHGSLYQVVIMQSIFDIENNQWRYHGSTTVVPATITIVMDNSSEPWNGRGKEKNISTLLEDQLIVFLDSDVQAVVQSNH